MKFIIIINIVSFLCTITLIQAQQLWSLEDCINHALKHNISLKQSELEIELSKNSRARSAKMRIARGL